METVVVPLFWRTTFTSMPPVHWLTMECVTVRAPVAGVGVGAGVGASVTAGINIFRSLKNGSLYNIFMPEGIDRKAEKH